MEISTILYYGGIALIICAVIFGIIALAIFNAKARHLKKDLDREYGAREKESLQLLLNKRSKEGG